MERKIDFFVLEILYKDGIYKQFNDLNVVFNCTFHDSELGKILRPSDVELSDFVIGNTETYYRRVEAILSCHICHCYTYLDTSNGYLSECRPFNCCRSTMEIALNIGSNLNFNRMMELLKKINYSFCKGIVRKRYDSLYTCE